MTSLINPYFNFDNQAKEAIEFYQSVFGGTLAVNTYKEGGMSDDPSQNDKIMHAMLTMDNGMVLMASDVPNSPDYTYNPGNNVSVSLSGEDGTELKGYWDKLADGAKIDMPLEAAPWGDTFGMLTDKFGIKWMVNISGKKQ